MMMTDTEPGAGTGAGSACGVCEQQLPGGKTRCHYGGVSCYSCRAFFRRNTQRQELPVCKAESGGCAVTASIRKQCAACRYQKCLRIGMRPELVLDDDEKKTRFRKFLSKKATGESFPVASTGGQPQPPGRAAAPGGRRGQKRPRASSSQCHERAGDEDTEMLRHAPVPLEVEVKTEADGGDLAGGDTGAEGFRVSGLARPREAERRLQQEILWLRLGSQEPVQVAGDETFIKQEQGSPAPAPAPRSVIASSSSKLDILAQIAPEELREYLGNIGGQQQQQQHQQQPSTVIRPKQETDFPPQPPQGSPWPQQQQQPVRKSVIVRAGSQAAKLEDEDEALEAEGDMSDVISNAMSLLPATSEVLANLGEEAAGCAGAEAASQQIAELVSVMTARWTELSYGRQPLQEYVQFCLNRKDFPFNFYNNNTIRERCLRILNSMEELSSLTYDDKKALIRSNGSNAEMFSYVHTFNKSTWEEELDFLFGHDDKLFWMTCNPPIIGVPLSTVITSSPLTELSKLDLYRTLASAKPQDGLLADSVVFCLTLLIILLAPAPGCSAHARDTAARALNKYESLLLQYLQTERKLGVDTDMKTVYSCINILPKMARIFSSLRSAMHV